MTLGVATYGGATVPDFLSGAIMGTAYAIISGKGAEYGIGVAVPIGLLLTQLDILGRMANTFFQHKADRYAEEGKIAETIDSEPCQLNISRRTYTSQDYPF